MNTLLSSISMRKIIYIIYLALFSVGCAGKVKIQSEPSDAEVFVSAQSSLDRKSLGKTPLEIDYSELSNKAGGAPQSGEFFVLNFELKDHETEKVLLPAQPFGTTKTQVVAKMIPSNEATQARDILQRLHNAQKFAQSSQFERALVEIDKVLEIDSKFARALSLKGSVFYLQKKYDEAILWFEKSLAIDPSFEDAVRMINKIKSEKKK